MIGPGDGAKRLLGCPWHGLIRQYLGLDLPNGRHIAAQMVGQSTGVFDAGLPPAQTPDAVTLLGGELWNRAIVNWSPAASTAIAGYHCRISSDGVPLTLPGDRWTHRFCRASLTPGGSIVVAVADPLALSGGVSTDIATTLAGIGQGAGQPDIYIRGSRAGGSINTLGRPQSFRLELADFWKNKMLFLVRASGNDLSAPGFDWNDRSSIGQGIINNDVPFGLIEIEIGAPDSSGIPPCTVRVIEDRAAAFGTITNTVIDSDAMTRVYATSRIETGDGELRYYVERLEAPPAFGYIQFDTGTRSNSLDISIDRALLAANYDEHGVVRTARYSVSWVETRSEDRQHTDVNGFRLAGTFESGATYVLQHYTISYSMEQSLTLYGFDGQPVDQYLFTDHGDVDDTRPLNLRAAPGALPAPERVSSRTRQFGDDTVTQEVLYPVAGAPAELRAVPRPPALSADVLLHWARGDGVTNRNVGIRQYSNNLVSLYSASREATASPPYWLYTTRYGPACHPTGVEPAPAPLVTTDYDPIARMHGSYNPISGEVDISPVGLRTWV